MKNLLSVLLPVLLLSLVACGGGEHEQHHEAIPKLEVSTPLLKDTIVTRQYVCQIHAYRHIELRALERGYLEKVLVDEGKTVQQGQALFRIMPKVYEAELQMSLAEANTARIEYENTKMLAEKNIVSQNELALAKAKLDKAQAEVNLSQTHLDFTKINAPFTGLIDHLEAREGSLLEEGELLTTLSDNSKMWVYFNVPEAEYLNYAEGKTKKLSTVRLKMANSKIYEHQGNIETIEADFDSETGNIEFRATFPNPKRLLRHGETGNILMDTPVKDGMIIPQKATFEVLDKIYVFVVGEGNRLEQREITIAHELPQLFIVESGLKPTDKILLEGLNKVHNGDEIETTFKDPAKAYSDLNLYAE